MGIRIDTTAWEITTDRLTVRVAKPGLQYQRTRFDWMGFVTDVLLDGQHTFCSVESPHPLQGTGGVGLCNEFGISEPIGHDDAAVGEPFPKLGVGLLTKEENAPYAMTRAYPLLPFPCETTLLDDGIRFEISSLPCRGYAAHLTKTLTVSGNTIRMAYHLKNEGSQWLDTTEYNHNFLLLDREPIGAGYTLSFSAPLMFTRRDGTTWSTSGVLTWPDNPSLFYTLCTQIPPMDTVSWTLRHESSGLSVTEQLDARPVRIACWGLPHVVSPEMFHAIRIQPGETAEWTRVWTFRTRED